MPRAKKEYRIFQEVSIDDLSNTITQQLYAGWMLWGDPFVSIEDEETRYNQAMAYAPKKEEKDA